MQPVKLSSQAEPADLAVLQAAGLRIRFYRRGDRIAHVIERLATDETANAAAADEGSAPGMTSVEGTPDEDWPPSPPFQSVHQEQRPGGVQVALLVGMAGSSHWSASVELEPAGRLSFDVACRLRIPPRFLGSTYQNAGGLKLTLLDGTEEVNLKTAAAMLQVCPHPPAVEQGPATIRWRYLVQLLETSRIPSPLAGEGGGAAAG